MNKNEMKQTVESRELFLYTINDYTCYKQAQAIIKNLAKKNKLGLYDKEKSLICFQRLTRLGSDNYFREFGYKFSVADRKLASYELLEYYHDNIIKNDI